jgi:hypothetical protein
MTANARNGAADLLRDSELIPSSTVRRHQPWRAPIVRSTAPARSRRVRNRTPVEPESYRMALSQRVVTR